MKLKIVILCSLISAWVFTGCVEQGESIKEDEVITLKDFENIYIDSQIADVYVIQEDREDVYAILDTYENGPRLKVDESGKTLTIEAKREGNLVMSISFYNSPTLKVYIPKDYDQNLTVDNSSGNLDLKNIELSDMKLDLKSGNVTGKSVQVAACEIDNSSGNVNIKNMTCDTLTGTLHSGNITLDQYIGELSLDTSSGNTDVDFEEVPDQIDIKGSSGNVKLYFPSKDLNTTFDLQCSSGNVHCFDLDSYEDDDDNEVRGKIGTGETSVKVRVSSGNITVQ